MALIDKIYSDIDFRFLPQPGNRDVSVRYNEQAVIQSVKNLILTAPYERPFNPTLGSTITKLLFEPCTPFTASAVKDEIIRTIENFEPRARIAVVDVVATPDQNAFQATIVFFVTNQTTSTTVNLLLKRAR